MAAQPMWVGSAKRAIASMRCASLICQWENPMLQRGLTAAGHAVASHRAALAREALQHLLTMAGARNPDQYRNERQRTVHELAVQHMEEVITYLEPHRSR